MILDINGVEINVGDEVIMGTGIGCYKAKIAKETIGRIHYYDWNELTKSYRDYSWCGNKSSHLMSRLYKI